MRWLDFLLLILTLWTTGIFAGDTSRINVIGFSESGKYFAFERYGIEEGSLESYSEIFVLDVDSNRFAASPIRLRNAIDEAPIRELRQRNLQSAISQLVAYGIRLNNSGELLLYHPVTDLTYRDNRQYFSTEESRVTFVVPDGFTLSDTLPVYELLLRHISTDRICPVWDEPAQMLELRLLHQGKAKILQKDEHLPESRGCVLCYRIESVYNYGDKIVVFIAATVPGFEGLSVRHLVVSGTLEME